MGSIETGNIISKVRKEKNMTQKELASLLNVTDKEVIKWERGESYPDVALLPILSNILYVSIDELLGIENMSNEEVYVDNNTRYKCLLEDCQYRFDRNWFYVYCLMVLAMFSSFVTLPFNLNLIVRTVFPLFLLGLFYFIDRKYQLSIRRYKDYIDGNFCIIDKKPYFQILIVLAIQCYVMYVMTNTTISYEVIHDVQIRLLFNHSFMLYIYIINVVVLYIVVLKYSKYINKVNIFIIINLLVNFLLCIIMVIFRVYVKIQNPMVKMSVKRLVYPNVICLVILLFVALSLSFVFFKLKKVSLRGRVILFVISIFENSMILVAYNSVQYITNDVNNFCFIDNFNIKSIFLIFVILYYISVITYEKATKQV